MLPRGEMRKHHKIARTKRKEAMPQRRRLCVKSGPNPGSTIFSPELCLMDRFRGDLMGPRGSSHSSVGTQSNASSQPCSGLGRDDDDDGRKELSQNGRGDHKIGDWTPI